MTVETRAQDRRTGITHNVKFAAAGVAPRSHGLASRGAFLAAESSDLEARFAAAMAAAWVSAFCGQPSSREEAARCAYGNPSPPPYVMQALKASMGPDADPLLKRVHRAPVGGAGPVQGAR